MPRRTEVTLATLSSLSILMIVTLVGTTSLSHAEEVVTILPGAHDQTRLRFLDIIFYPIERGNELSWFNEDDINHKIIIKPLTEEKNEATPIVNPDTIKRFLNGYARARNIAILARVRIDRNELALWIIINIRWPNLASYLKAHPEMIKYVGKGKEDLIKTDIPNNFQGLFIDPDVCDVVHGKGVGSSLHENTIRIATQIFGF